MPYTTQPIKSHSKGTLYAPAGAEVTLIHTTGHVAICEYLGERFPCRVELLSDTKPDVQTAPAAKKLTAKEQQLIDDYLKLKR